MNECFVCGDDATFIKENGGHYMCRQCIHDGKDLE
jgi:ribosomal protein S14